MRCFFCIMTVLSFCCTSLVAQVNNVGYDISFPTKSYFMQGVENSVFFQAISRRWHPYDNYVRVSGLEKIDYHSDKKVLLSKFSDSDVMQLDLIDGMTFDTIKTIKSVIKYAEPYTGKGEVSVQFLGDSYTAGNYFKYAFLESGYVPGIRLIGTRSVNGYEDHGHEGRGGWTIYKYCTTEKGQYYYNPLCQPDGGYKYWGSTAFWRNCFKVKANPKDGEFSLRYYCSNYNLADYTEDGKRKNPTEMDMMWDSDAECYIYWSRGKWRKLKDDDLNWKFNYGKYLEMNGFKSPDYLILMFGLNDFRDGSLNPDFKTWNNTLLEMAKSYHSTNPGGKFVICTPCSSCGVMNNERGTFTVRQNAVMWEVRKNIIDNFDNLEDEGIYVVDASATIDNENGYNMKNGVQTGNPHPYPNYPALGIPIAAFVQYFRNK